MRKTGNWKRTLRTTGSKFPFTVALLPAPGIHFHHGRELEMEDVITSLTRINTLPLYSHITKIDSPTAWTLDIHLSQPDRWLPWLLGQVPAMILPREWETLANFASHPIGTGPYAVRRNTPNQLKILAFDDYFGYRALIDEVNVWVLPDISEEPACGLMLEGPIQGGEKAIESRLEEGCYYLLFDARTPRGAHLQVREWVSHVLSPPIYSIMPMNRYSSSGSRPMGFYRAGITPVQARAKNPPGWKPSR
ncbi:ABC transporter periplasmic solute binding protein [Salmonella enterica subsp. enterica]|nr:ABC transporter periplasmic solute binding protein [Salmonella enterica subsp. enterica]